MTLNERDVSYSETTRLAEEAYTSTGVRPPCVTEQQTAPAKANLEYNAKPLSFSGVCALVFCTTASSLVEPVDDGAADAAILGVSLVSEDEKVTGSDMRIV